MDNCDATTKKVDNANDNLQTSDKKMPWVQKVAILDTRQKVGLKHQQRIEGSPGSVSIRINIWTLTELCNCQILIYLEIKARE